MFQYKVFFGMFMAMAGLNDLGSPFKPKWFYDSMFQVPYLLCRVSQKKYLVPQQVRFVTHIGYKFLNSDGALTHLESEWESEIALPACTQLQKAAVLGKPWPCCCWPPGRVSHRGESGGSNDYTIHTGESIIVPKSNKQRSIETGLVFVRLYSIQSFCDCMYSSVYLCNKLPL